MVINIKHLQKIHGVQTVAPVWPPLVNTDFTYLITIKKLSLIIDEYNFTKAQQFLFWNVVEHCSYLLTGIITTKRENSHEVFEIYVLKMFPQVFTVITYNTWIAVLALVINSVSTLTLCFSDQIIIMGSLALGNYFQIFNDRMKIHKGKVYCRYT